MAAFFIAEDSAGAAQGMYAAHRPLDLSNAPDPGQANLGISMQHGSKSNVSSDSALTALSSRILTNASQRRPLDTTTECAAARCLCSQPAQSPQRLFLHLPGVAPQTGLSPLLQSALADS